MKKSKAALYAEAMVGPPRLYVGDDVIAAVLPNGDLSLHEVGTKVLYIREDDALLLGRWIVDMYSEQEVRG